MKELPPGGEEEEEEEDGEEAEKNKDNDNGQNASISGSDVNCGESSISKSEDSSPPALPVQSHELTGKMEEGRGPLMRKLKSFVICASFNNHFLAVPLGGSRSVLQYN